MLWSEREEAGMRRRQRAQPTASRRGLFAAVACAAFVLTLPGVFGHVAAAVETVLFDTATAGPDPTNTTQTSSFSSSTTFTRVDLADMEVFETRVVAELDGAVVFDQTVADAPDSAAVAAAFAEATAALAGACAVSGPSLVSSSDTAETVQLRDEENGSEETVTLEETIGAFPDGTIIFVGENRSEEFLVRAGTVNANEAYHTEFFVNQVFQTTVTNQATYRLAGEPCPAAAPTEAVEVPAVPPPQPAPAAAPVVAPPRMAG